MGSGDTSRGNIITRILLGSHGRRRRLLSPGEISMESVRMGSLEFHFSRVGLIEKGQSCGLLAKGSFRIPVRVRCGLRDAGPRGQLWRSRVLSSEAIQAVQALKLAKSSSPSSLSQPPSSRKLEDVFNSRIRRLLKADLLSVLTELQRQNEWELAVQVFRFIREEVWYKPDLRLYSDMIFMAGKNKLIEIAEDLFSEMKAQGLQPDTRAYTEMIGAFLHVDMVERAMEMYKLMKESGVTPSELTFTIMIRNLEKAEKEELASIVRKDCAEFLDYPERFLKEVEKKYPKRKSIKLV